MITEKKNQNNNEEKVDESVIQGIGRREFLDSFLKAIPAGLSLLTFGFWSTKLNGSEDSATSSPPSEQNSYAMAVDISKCIGCGRCANACKQENHVPAGPHYMRTWIERYVIPADGEVIVDSPNGGIDGFPDQQLDANILRTFYVPKLCNHCANPPCVQVCPVGATYQTKDGVVLVDDQYCVGCRYCIQACPYGARFMHPEKNVADKCTFCYHRIAKGLLPACVEVCPTQTRVFGDLKKRSSPILHFLRFNPIRTLKAELNTRAKVFYANADEEVR